VDRPLPAVFFRTEAGREPVREWLQGLPRHERRIIGIDIMTVQYRWPLGMPLVRNLGSALWEIRSALQNRIARRLFLSSAITPLRVRDIELRIGSRDQCRFV